MILKFLEFAKARLLIISKLCIQVRRIDQAIKGVRWMPWH